MISEKFDARTLAKMEAALELACTAVAIGKQHEARRHIALSIMERARSGEAPIETLTGAGQIAASELCMEHWNEEVARAAKRELRKQAVANAHATLEQAKREHDARVSTIESERAALEKRHKLESALRQAQD